MVGGVVWGGVGRCRAGHSGRGSQLCHKLKDQITPHVNFFQQVPKRCLRHQSFSHTTFSHTHTTLPQFFHTTLPHTTLYINFVTHAHRHTTLSHLFGTYWKKVIFGVFRSFNFRVHWEHVCARKMAIGFSIAVFDHRRAFRAGRVHRVQTTSYGKGWRSPNQIAISHQFLMIHARFVREGVGLLGIDRHRAAAKGYSVFRRSFTNLHIIIYTVVDV
jgi:hypothetical protein